MLVVFTFKINEFHRMPLFKIAINEFNGEKNVFCPCITVRTVIIILFASTCPYIFARKSLVLRKNCGKDGDGLPVRRPDLFLN
jgi:hypothetical protein